MAGAEELVTANLTGGMLISSAARIQSLLTARGVLVISGFDEDERATVVDAFAPMQPRAAFSEDGWVGVVLDKT